MGTGDDMNHLQALLARAARLENHIGIKSVKPILSKMLT